MMINNISRLDKCVNCGACLNICPVDAIYITTNNFFLSPFVTDKCINCGKCIKVCPLQNNEIKQKISMSIGGYSLEKKDVLQGSSGGAFGLIGEYILNNGGVVVSAIYDDDYKKVIFSNTDKTPLQKFKKSKYVESRVGHSFRFIKKQLLLDRKVLFCGTPCQVAGLKCFLGKEYDNLITCDFACGGLPSHQLYEDYIDFLEKKYNSKISHIDFRPGIYGWINHSLLCTFENKKQYKEYSYLDPYFFAFIHKSISIRDECYDCKFVNNHYSDIILADFWKYKELSSITNKDGISLLLSNSKKGDEILEYLKTRMMFEVLDIKSASYNCFSTKNRPNSDKRKEFFSLAQKYSLLYATKQIGLPTGLKSALYKFKRFLSRLKNGN